MPSFWEAPVAMTSFFERRTAVKWVRNLFGRKRKNILGRKVEALHHRYEVAEQELEKGEMAVVRLAKDKKTGDAVLLKTMKKSCLKTEEDFEGVRSEVAILELLTGHPNIVAHKGTLEDRRGVHVALEVCMGETLLDSINRRGQLTEKTVARMMEQVLKAVQHCHRKNVVHRDLRPENFAFVDNQDSPLKLRDFGMATMLTRGEVAKDVQGSVYYIAPEVLQKSYGKECDMWSCGVILYLLLTGKLPFGRGSQRMILDAVLKGDLDLQSPPWPQYSEEAKDLVRQMLTKVPQKRITAEDALKHAWFTGRRATEDVAVGGDVISNLRRFSAANKMKKLALKVVANNMSRDKIVEMREQFIRMDKNRDGVITFSELRDGMRKLNASIPEEQLREIMNAADLDNSGCIDYSEFITATLKMNAADKEEHYLAAFQLFDEDDSGTISLKELRQALSREMNLQPGEVERIMADVDKNGDGEIDFDEFVDMMRSRDQGSLDDSPLRHRSRAVY